MDDDNYEQNNNEENKTFIKCIHNDKATFFGSENKKTITLYECSYSSCLKKMKYMCRDCAKNCHNHMEMGNMSKKEVFIKNVACGCALKNHMLDENEKEIREVVQDETGETACQKLVKFLKYLNINLCAKNKDCNTKICLFCYENCNKNSENYVIENNLDFICDCKDKDEKLPKTVRHDFEFMKRKILYYILEKETYSTKINKLLIMGKVFSDDVFFKNEFTEFERINTEILKVPLPEELHFTNYYEKTVEIMSLFTNTNKKVVFEISKEEKYSLKTFNLNLILNITKLILNLFMKVEPSNHLEVTCGILPKMLHYFKHFYIYPKIGMKNVKKILKNYDTVSPIHRDFFREDITEFFKHAGEENDGEFQKNFEELLENTFTIIVKLKSYKLKLGGYADLIKNYLQFQQIFLCYKLKSDYFENIVKRIHEILIICDGCWKNCDIDLSKTSNKHIIIREDVIHKMDTINSLPSKPIEINKNYHSNDQEKKQNLKPKMFQSMGILKNNLNEIHSSKEIITSGTNLMEDDIQICNDVDEAENLLIKKLLIHISKMIPTVVIYLNDMQFQTQVFNDKGGMGYIFSNDQNNYIQKLILQIVFYSEKIKSCHGVFIYNLMLKTHDMYLDPIQNMISSDSTFDKNSENNYRKIFTFDESDPSKKKIDDAEKKISQYTSDKYKYFFDRKLIMDLNNKQNLSVGNKRMSTEKLNLSPIKRKNVYNMEMISDDIENLNKINEICIKIKSDIETCVNLKNNNDKFTYQMCLAKKGYIELLLDLYKLITQNSYVPSILTDEYLQLKKATVKSIRDSLLKLTEYNEFLSGVFFTNKIVDLFYNSYVIDFYWETLGFYLKLLKNFHFEKVKINVNYLLHKLTEKNNIKADEKRNHLIYKMYYYMLSRCSDNHVMYCNEVLVKIAIDLIRSLNETSFNLENVKLETNIFRFLNKISKSYFYLIRPHLNLKIFEEKLIKNENIIPELRRIIHKCYLKYKIRYPFILSLDENNTAVTNNSETNDIYLQEKEHFKIVFWTLENFNEITEESSFNNNISNLFEFFERMVFDTTYYSLYNIVYFNEKVNNYKKYFIFYIVLKFIECNSKLIERALQKSDMTMFDVKRFLENKGEANIDQEADSFRLSLQKVFKEINNLKQIMMGENYDYLDYKKNIKIFNTLAKTFKRFKKISHPKKCLIINKKLEINYSNDSYNEFHNNVICFFLEYTKIKKNNNLLQEIMQISKEDECYEKIKTRLINDLIRKFIKNTTDRIYNESTSITIVKNEYMKSYLSEFLNILRYVMKLDNKKDFKSKFLDKELAKDSYLKVIIKNQLPLLLKILVIEFYDVNSSNIVILPIIIHILKLLEYFCDEELADEISNIKIEFNGEEKYLKDFLIIFLSSIIECLIYNENKIDMVKLFKSQYTYGQTKQKFFKKYHKKIFYLMIKLVKYSKKNIYDLQNKQTEKHNIELRKHLLELLKKPKINYPIFKDFLSNYISLFETISFRFNTGFNLKISDFQTFMIYLYDELIKISLGENSSNSKNSDNKANKIKNKEHINNNLNLLEKIKKQNIKFDNEYFKILSKIYLLTKNISNYKDESGVNFKIFFHTSEIYYEKILKNPEEIHNDIDKMKLALIGQLFKYLIQSVEISVDKKIVDDIIKKKNNQENDDENNVENKLKILKIYFLINEDCVRIDKDLILKIFLFNCPYMATWNEKISYLVNYTPYFIKIFGSMKENDVRLIKMSKIFENPNLKYYSSFFSFLTNILVLLTIYYTDSNDFILQDNFFNLTRLISGIHVFILGLCIPIMTYIEWIKYQNFKQLQNDNYCNKQSKLEFFQFFNVNLFFFVWNFIFGSLGMINRKMAFLFSLQLFSVYFLNETMRLAITSAWKEFNKFVSAGLVIIIFIIFYSLISITYFKDKFFNPDLNENSCGTVYQCIMSLLSNGVRDQAGFGFSITSMSDPYYWSEFLFEWVFYFTIILILLNIVNGIIVDSFQQNRENSENNKNKSLTEMCYICSCSKSLIESHGVNFENHINNDHNIISYMKYIMILRSYEEKKLKKYGSSDSLQCKIASELKEEKFDFIPFKSVWAFGDKS